MSHWRRFLLCAALSLLAIVAFAGDASSARAQTGVSIAGGCAPDAIRPGAPALVRCTFEVINGTADTLEEARITIFGSPPPSLRYFIIGRPPRGAGIPVIELGTVPPGGRAGGSTAVIVKTGDPVDVAAYVNEGAKGETLATLGLELKMQPGAAAPARDLRVFVQMDEPQSFDDPAGEPDAGIAIIVRNESSSALRDVVVRDEFTGGSYGTLSPARWDTQPSRSEDAAVEWDVGELQPGEKVVFHGLMAQGPCRGAEHGVVASGVDEGGGRAEGADVGRWYHRICECGNVDCFLPPSPTAAPTSVPTTTVAAPAAEAGEPTDDGMAWAWAGFGGAGVLVAGAAVAMLLRRHRG